MTVPLLAWVATLGSLLALLVLDWMVAGRRRTPIGIKLAGT